MEEKSLEEELNSLKLGYQQSIQFIDSFKDRYVYECSRLKSLQQEFESKNKGLELRSLLLESEKKSIEKEKKEIQDFKNKLNALVKTPQKIKLNVGGKIFTSSVLTLTSEKSSLLAAMFNGQFDLKQDDDGEYFIDRDSKYFDIILNYLRGQSIALNNLTEQELHALKEEVEFYEIKSFYSLIEQYEKSSLFSNIHVFESYSPQDSVPIRTFTPSSSPKTTHPTLLKRLSADIKITEISPNPPKLDTSWMDTTDKYNGFKSFNCCPKIKFAVSKKNIWDPHKIYDCPSGYHWASAEEYLKECQNIPKTTKESPYHNQGGWIGYSWNGVQRDVFVFKDSFQNNKFKHVGVTKPESLTSIDSQFAGSILFAGIVCIQN